ncbi:MAG: glycosyltransferase family 4 protein [Candidatus Aminicenantes bacterium]|nr:glycosyltransferase family 4 protein [Candidatus Aminicenantes bacterium]
MPQKIGIIVQRYGLEINGGAEYHARLIAEKIRKYFDIEVFTSTALDYITWEHHYPEGRESINDIPVNRFKVEKVRDPKVFGEIQDCIFNEEHTAADELKWLEEEGPYLPALIEELERRENDFAYFIFFSYRYYHSYVGVKKFKDKAILVPTAEHDEVVYLRLFKDFFNLPAAFVYNSYEEREIIHKVSGNFAVPGDVVGVGSDIPAEFSPAAFREKFAIRGKYFIYIGRLDENKGVPQLLDFFTRLLEEEKIDLTLVMGGKSLIEIPAHPQIKYLGFMSDEDKFDALTGAEFLINPSQFESLSMVILEAWALGKPVLVNGRTEVLQGQCRRSNAGLWYTGYREFKEILLLLDQNNELREIMGKNGVDFFEKNYSWPVIEDKYLKIIEKLQQS